MGWQQCDNGGKCWVLDIFSRWNPQDFLMKSLRESKQAWEDDSKGFCPAAENGRCCQDYEGRLWGPCPRENLVCHVLNLTHPADSQAEISAAAAKSLQCSPIDGSPPGSPVPGILQASESEVAQSCLTLSDPMDLKKTK